MNHLVKFDIGLDNAFGAELQLLSDIDLDYINHNIGKHIYLGEIEGKHSEVSGNFTKEDYKILSSYEDDSDFVKEFERVLPRGFGIDIWYTLSNDEN